MLTAFLATLEQMVRISLFLVIGFGLNRFHILPRGTGGSISRLATMVLLPALLIYSNMTEFNLANVRTYSRIVLLGALFWAVTTLISVPIAKKLSGGSHLERGVYLYGLSFPNNSAVGTPLVLALFGTAGLFQFNLFLLLNGIMTYAWGVNLFLETQRKNPLKAFFDYLLSPVFISMIIGMVLGALGAKNWMPSLATDFLKDLAGCYVPISLLMTGYSIADYPIKEAFNRPKSYVYTLLRLIVFPLLVLGAAKWLGLSLFEASLVTFAFAGPSGMNVVVFPTSYGQDCKTGASIVLLSSLGAILTVPVLYALVQYLFR